MAEFAGVSTEGLIPVPSGCPVAHGFNPHDTGAHLDPFPWYRKVREQGPVVFVPVLGDAGMYAVTRHEEVLEVLRDPVTYSNAEALGTSKPVPAVIREEAGDENWDLHFDESMTLLDPPEHTRMRRLQAPTLTPRRVAAYEDDVREIAHARIDEFVDRGTADLAAEFAYRIPNRVIARIMGADEALADRFVEWTDALIYLRMTEQSEEDALRHWRLLLEYDRYIRALVEEHRRDPKDDLTTDLIDARDDDGGPAMTDEEIVCTTLGFIGAGSETSAVMMLHTMHLLLTHPEQWEEVRADRSLIPAAIEEGLRLRGPVRGIIRVVTADTELAGVPIPKGARVYLHIMSANHDDDAFERPEAFDIHRADKDQHLGFGKWAHFCIGAPLARLEGRVAIETLIDRLPGLRLAHDYERDYGYRDNFLVPLVKALRVEWD